MTPADTNQPSENQQSGETSTEETRRIREAVLGWLEKSTAPKPHQKPAQVPKPPKPIEPPAKATRADVATKSPQAPLVQRAERPAVEQPKPASRKKGGWRRTVSLVAGGMMAGLVLVVAVFGLLLYQFKWQAGWAAAVTSIIPYPVVIVDYRPLPYRE